MSEALSAALNAPEVRNKLEEQGADVVGSGPERTRRFLNAEIQKWGQVIRDNNITLES
jgi:tripartite-type tricarboxylate transporter receptor subunit TctC